MRLTGRELFPTILILDAEGEQILTLDRATLSASIGSGGIPVAALDRKLDACERYVALRARVAAGEASAKAEMLVSALEIGKIEPDAFDKAAAGLTIPPELAKSVARIRANAVCEALVARMRASGQDPAVEKEATEEFLKLYEKGTHPDSDSAGMYWWFVGTHAKATEDRVMIERCTEGLLATGGRERFGPLIAELEARLKALRAPAR